MIFTVKEVISRSMKKEVCCLLFYCLLVLTKGDESLEDAIVFQDVTNIASPYEAKTASEESVSPKGASIFEDVPVTGDVVDSKEMSPKKNISVSEELAESEDYPASKNISSFQDATAPEALVESKVSVSEKPVGYKEITVSDEVQASKKASSSEDDVLMLEDLPKSENVPKPNELPVTIVATSSAKPSTKKVVVSEEISPLEVSTTKEVSTFPELTPTLSVTSEVPIPNNEAEISDKGCSIDSMWAWHCPYDGHTYLTYEACAAYCVLENRQIKPKEERPSICKVPRVPIGILEGRTPCRHPTEAWSFYPDTEQCELVPGGGCTMLSYVYQTKEECLAACVWGYEKTDSMEKRESSHSVSQFAITDLIKKLFNIERKQYSK